MDAVSFLQVHQFVHHEILHSSEQNFTPLKTDDFVVELETKDLLKCIDNWGVVDKHSS